MRVLVVEDDCLIALCLEDALASLGYGDVCKAADLATARRFLDQMAPRLAILDVNLGRETVFEFAAELTARGIPFVFSTGNPRNSFPAEWRDHQIVPKPVQTRTLEAALRAILAPGNLDMPCDVATRRA